MKLFNSQLLGQNWGEKKGLQKLRAQVGALSERQTQWLPVRQLEAWSLKATSHPLENLSTNTRFCNFILRFQVPLPLNTAICGQISVVYISVTRINLPVSSLFLLLDSHCSDVTDSLSIVFHALGFKGLREIRNNLILILIWFPCISHLLSILFLHLTCHNCLRIYWGEWEVLSLVTTSKIRSSCKEGSVWAKGGKGWGGKHLLWVASKDHHWLQFPRFHQAICPKASQSFLLKSSYQCLDRTFLAVI